MELKALSDKLYVSPQVDPAAIPALKDAGIRAIICNRPDDEEAGQPSFAQIEQAAKQLGLTAVHQPIVPGQIGPEDVDSFARTLSDLPGPVLAFCRTGMRSSTLFDQSQA